MRHRVVALLSAVLLIAWGVAGAQNLGRVRPLDIVPDCTPSATVFPLAGALNADQSWTTTWTGQLNCNMSGDFGGPACIFCITFQMVWDQAPNLQQVVQPPYPVAGEMAVTCGTGVLQQVFDTSPPLPFGTYEM